MSAHPTDPHVQRSLPRLPLALLRVLLPRAERDEVIADVIVRTGRSDSMGTASAHSANMAAVATVMTGLLGWRWGAPWIMAALLTGYSRVFNGVHWPSQVTLGWIVGTLVGLATVWVYRRVLAARGVKNEEDGQSEA